MSDPGLSRQEWQRRLRMCRKMIRAGKTTTEIRQETLVSYPDIALQRRIMIANGEMIEGEAGSYSGQKRRGGNRVAEERFDADLVDVFAAPRSRKSLSYFNNFD
jgi:hypothetical protein